MTLSPTFEERIARLERSVGRARLLASTFALALLGLVSMALGHPSTQIADEVRTRRLIVLDDQGHTRLVLGQDPASTQRISRAAGLILIDDKGNERGGFSTMADGSVVLGMDAPRGVGAPMPDRMGLKVYPDGSAHVMLIDNETRAVAKLDSDAQGRGGVVVYKWDMVAKQIHRRTLTFDGEIRDSVPFGQ